MAIAVVETSAATSTGISEDELALLTEDELRALYVWMATKAGDDDGRPFYPRVIRSMPIEQKLVLARDPKLDAIWEVREQKRVEADVRYFIANYGHVQPEIGDPIPFDLWPEQVEVLEAFIAELRIIILKARQLGLTWLALHFGFWLQAFCELTPRIKVLCLSKHGGDATKLLQRSRRINDLLPPYLRKKEDQDTRGSLSRFKLQGRGEMISLPGTPAAARSETAGLVIADEFGFIKNKQAGDTYTAFESTLGALGKAIVISTGNGPPETPGDGQALARLWTAARSGANKFKAIFLKTTTHPDRDAKWREEKRDEYLEDEEFEAEHPESEEEALQGTPTDKVYSPAGINAAEKLGRKFDSMVKAGDMPPPDEGMLLLGWDWGEQTHGLIAWPLERGGFYIEREIVASHEDPTDVSKAAIAAAARVPDYDDQRNKGFLRVKAAHYDAAGVQSMRTFAGIARRSHPSMRTVKVPFGELHGTGVRQKTYKAEGIGYIRRLIKRTAKGRKTQVIAISPKCKVLLRQMRGLELADDDSGKVDKHDDHGPDALIAVVAPTARRFRAR